MANPETYRPETGSIPTDPGVYTFRDKHDRVLYVGKAKNLRNRLSNYFQSPDQLHPRTRNMVYTADHVQWTVVDTEVEALNLEYTLIKRFNPRFNVMLKDGKSYPMLAVSNNEEVPRAFLYRGERRKGIRYYGPYPKAWAIKETLEMLTKVFPVRTCTKGVYTSHQALQRPCLLGHIGRCSAPCAGKISVEDHRELVKQFNSFMSGNTATITRDIEAKMHAASEELDFEKAATYRDQLKAIDQVMEKQASVLPSDADADIIALSHDELEAAIQMFHVRSGRLVGQQGWIIDISMQQVPDQDTSSGFLPSNDEDSITESSETLLAPYVEDFLNQYYGDNFELSESLVEKNIGGAASSSGSDTESALEATIPREVLIPLELENQSVLEQWLSSLRGSNVDLRMPQRGDKKALMDTVKKNSELALAQHKLKRSSDITTRSTALTELQEALDISEPPLRIECTDISHIQGTDVVASLVVFEDGLPKKSDYRRYKVKEAAGEGRSDDVASIAEIVRRRFARHKYNDRIMPTGDDGVDRLEGEHELELSEGDQSSPPKFAYPPQLFIVDGGKPQVNAAAAVLNELGIDDVVLVGMAKRLEEIWVPGEDYPVILSRNSEALYLLQRIRDEAHRLAIDFHRQQRSKRMRHSVLDDIPGLGEVRRKALVKQFKSVAKLKEASVEEIAQTPGFGPATASQIFEALHEHDASSESAMEQRN